MQNAYSVISAFPGSVRSQLGEVGN